MERQANKQGLNKSRSSRLLLRGLLMLAVLSLLTPVAYSQSKSGSAPAPKKPKALSDEVGKILDDYSVTRWGRSAIDGLPEDSVKAVLITRDGYLWSLTASALVRFDGVKFSRLALPQGSDGSAWQGLAETFDGRLWLYGKPGAYFFAPQAATHGYWSRFPLPQTPVLHIVQERNTNTWVVVSNGLYQINLPQPRFFGLPAELGLEKASIKAVAYAPNRPLFLAVGKAVIKFSNGSFEWEHQLDLPVECMSLDRAGFLWVATSFTIYRGRSGEWSRIPLPKHQNSVPWQIRCLKAFSSQQLWVGTTSGLYRWNQSEWSELTPRDGYYPLSIQHLEWKEADGNIWAGTDGGLMRLGRRVAYVYGSDLGLFKDSFTAILPDSEWGLLAGIAGGGLLRGKQGEFEPFTQIPLSRTAIVSALLNTRDGARWIGTQGDYVWRYTTEGSVCIAESPGERRSAVNVNALLEDRQGRIFVGTGNGVMRFNPLKGCLEPLQESGLSGTVHALLEDSRGAIWVASRESGVAVIATNGTVRSFSSEHGLPSRTVLALCQDKSGLLWAGTADGLACWDGTQWKAVTKRQGLFDGPVSQLLVTDSELWMGTHYGIARMELKHLAEVAFGRKSAITAVLYGRNEGMRGSRCNSGFGNLAAKASSGHLLFCSADGLVMIDPKRAAGINKGICRAYIEEVKAGELSLCSIEDTVFHEPLRVSVPAGAGTLSFRFSAPIFSGAEHVQFKILLEGFDPEWTAPTALRTVSYPGLAPGKYTFRLMAGWGGVWRESVQTVAIEIKPFLWQRPGFWFCCALLAMSLTALLAWAVEKRRSRQKLLELEQVQALERERARIAHDLHDDLGAALTEIGLLSAMAQRPTVGPERARDYLGNITDKVRKVVETLDEIVWAVNPANDTVKSLGEYLCEYADRLLQLTPIRCRLDLATDLPSSPLDADRRHNVFLAFNEALNNVIRHSGATEVVIRIAAEKEQITVEIADNGCGFEMKSSQSKTGEGLKSMQARMQKLGGAFSLESQSGQGTTVRLAIPLK